MSRGVWWFRRRHHEKGGVEGWRGAARRVIIRHGSPEEASLTRRTGHATCKGPPYLAGTLPSRASRHRLTLCASVPLFFQGLARIPFHTTPTTTPLRPNWLPKKDPPHMPGTFPGAIPDLSIYPGEIPTKYPRNTNSRIARITHAVPITDDKHVTNRTEQKHKHQPTASPITNSRVAIPNQLHLFQLEISTRSLPPGIISRVP